MVVTVFQHHCPCEAPASEPRLLHLPRGANQVLDRCVDLARCTPSASSMRCSSDLSDSPRHVPGRQRSSNLSCVTPGTSLWTPAQHCSSVWPSFNGAVGRAAVELDAIPARQPRGVSNAPCFDWIRDVDVDFQRLFLRIVLICPSTKRSATSICTAVASAQTRGWFPPSLLDTPPCSTQRRHARSPF